MLRNARKLSIVIEMKNIEASGADRALTNTRQSQRQIAKIYGTLPGPITLKVAYDPYVFKASDAERFIKETSIGDNALIDTDTIGAPNLHYYEHKNIGARELNSDIILLLDSDILIADDWLRHMIAPFDDANVDFVTGRTHIETQSFLIGLRANDPAFPLAREGDVGVSETL